MAVTIKCGIKQNSQDIAGNTSSVTFYVDAISTGGSFNHNTSGSARAKYTCKFGGNAAGLGTITGYHTFNANTTTRIFSKTVDIEHDTDGTAAVNFSCSYATYVSSGTVSSSAKKTLTTIPRASTPSMSGNLTIGEAQTINTNRASSKFTHDITIKQGSTTIATFTGVGASKSWTPPMSLCEKSPNGTTVPITITCVTKSGSTTIGTKSKSVTLKIPSSVVPSFVSSSVTDANGYLDSYGKFVQGKSSMVATMEAQGAYGSTIKSYEASVDGLKGTATGAGEKSIALGAPTTSGSRTVTLKATDSRSRSITGTKAIEVAPYEAPSINAIAYRVNPETDEEDDESSTIRVEITGGVLDVNAAGLNSGTVKLEWKITTDEAYTTALNEDKGQSFSFYVDLADKSTTSRFDVKATVTDSFGTQSSIELQVNTAQPIMDFRYGGDGVAVLGISDRAGFRVGTDMSLDGTMSLEDEDGVSQAFLEAQANGRPTITNHAALANGTWLQGLLATGAASNILRMNDAGQVELNWTSGGLQGRVMKKIWSGTWGSGTITVSEAPYYRLFLFDLWDVAVAAIGYLEGDYLRGFGFYPYKANDGTDAFKLTGVNIETDDSHTKWTLIKCHNFSIYHDNTTGDRTSSMSVANIYGIL